MFSYINLVRVEIALEVGERFNVTIQDEETEGWQSSATWPGQSLVMPAE